MSADQNLIHKFIKEQCIIWEKMRVYQKKEELTHLPVITICMAAGSGGSLVAQQVADNLGFDLFHREIIQAIADSGHLDPGVLASMEKERLSGVQDFIASLLNDRYLWPGVYLDHLKKVVHAIADRGGAVIVGRGANFILSPAKTMSVRVVAPLPGRHTIGIEVPNTQRETVRLKELIQRAGVRRSRRRRRYLRILREVSVESPGKSIRILPFDGFRLTCDVYFQHPAVGRSVQKTQ